MHSYLNILPTYPIHSYLRDPRHIYERERLQQARVQWRLQQEQQMQLATAVALQPAGAHDVINVSLP